MLKFMKVSLLLSMMVPLWAACPLSVLNPEINPRPLDYRGTGIISVALYDDSGFNVPASDAFGDATCEFNIDLSYVEVKEHNLSNISGDLLNYFSVEYIFDEVLSSNRLHFSQIADFPADHTANINIDLDVTKQSTAAQKYNGFQLNIIASTIEASEFTYTNTLPIIANPNSIDNVTEGLVISNITENDTLDANAVQLGNDIFISTVTDNTPLDVNLSTGSVSVPMGTAGGSYVETYTICETSQPQNCSESNITVVVLSSVVDPDYELSLTISQGIFINNPGNFEAIIRVTEGLHGINTGDVVLSINKNNKMILAFDSGLTTLGGRILSNINWQWIETSSTYRLKYIGTDTQYPEFTRMYIGLAGIFTPPDSAKGKFPLKVKLRNGSGDTNPANNEDAEIISYSSDN